MISAPPTISRVADESTSLLQRLTSCPCNSYSNPTDENLPPVATNSFNQVSGIWI
ncbi:MAG: hypothetical protein P1U74_09745 [Legionellaceae bacterium]|nr:hypothetical protein [Legionellaceae bacterium]